MRILGISAFYHDSAAALVCHGEIVAAAQEERFSRKKHDHRFPVQAVKYCLDQANITVDQLDHVIFYDKPFTKFERLLETYLAYAPTGFKSFIMAMPLWLREKLWIPDVISKQLGYKGQILFCDRISYNEDDISAMRVKLSLHRSHDNPFTFGASNYKYRTKLSDGIIQNHDNYEVDLYYTKDFSQPGWKDAMNIEFSAEYSAFKNSNEDSVKSIWMEGKNIFLGTSLQFPAALKIYTKYVKKSFRLVETDFSRYRFTLGANYNLKNFKWNISGQFWKNYLPDSLNWADYYKYVEKTDGNGRWFQQYSELPFEKYTVLGYKSGLSWQSVLSYEFEVKSHKVETILKNKFAHQGLLTEPKFIENIIVLKYDIADKWQLKIDTRIPYYNDPFLELKTDFENDEDVFISNYCEISYYLSKNVWLALGYGVNPITINSITDEFYDRGREDYLNSISGLSEYLESYYGGFGNKIREAEILLMNEKRISIQAIVKF